MIFEFQDCRLDDEACELRRAGEAVPLQPKVLDVLLYLLRHRDRVVPKHELLDEVWPGVAVGDAVLTRAINLARAAVGDAGREQAVIRTLPRKGYRFSAEVRTREPRAPARSPALAEADTAYAARDWNATLEALDRAGSGAPLAAADLERRAWCQLWEARFDEATASFEQAEAAYESAGDRRGAAHAALQLMRDFFQHQQSALAAGWLKRAVGLLEGLPECEEHATAPPRCSSRRPSRARASWASTRTPRRSSGRGIWRSRAASRSGSASRWRPRRSSRARATTS